MDAFQNIVVGNISTIDYLIQNTNTLKVTKSNVTYQFQLYLAAFSLNQSGIYSSIVTNT